jgi:hypothetical protein
MNPNYPSLTRRCFLKSTAFGVLCSGVLGGLVNRLAAESPLGSNPAWTKVRVGKVYLGHSRPGWPKPVMDLEEEVRVYEDQIKNLGPAFADVEFVEGGLVSNDQQLAAAKEKMAGVDGILAIHLTLGTGPFIQGLLDLNIPTVLFTLPYSGHEWHIVASWQRQGKRIEVLPTSRIEDLPEAVRPFRAIHRLRETRILHVSHGDADPGYCGAMKEKFGTEIISLKLPDLEKAYQAADKVLAQADADQWMKEAEKIVEPSKEDIVKASLMYVAMKDLLAQHRAQAITMNCLGMGLVDRGMSYPCLGFVRFNNTLLAGVCEADLKSTMTQLIFTHLVGRTGFVTDPVFDLSNSTIIHAHCVAATQMQGPQSAPSPYHIRTHLEDNRGVSLQVRMPVSQPLSMARLIGSDIMLFSTGEAVDSPFVERGCRSKLTMRVNNIDRFIENWSCGLHRVIIYGDHSRDIKRFCRFMNLRLLHEGQDDLRNEPGLEWEAQVHA